MLLFIFDRVEQGTAMSRKSVLCVLILLFARIATAQVIFIVESLPQATPGTDTIFVCGTFNNWVPNEARYAVQRQLNGQLAVSVPLPSSGKIEYKFTRGSWTKVETSLSNTYIANRVFQNGSSPVYVSISNWLDLGGARQPNYALFYFFTCAFQGMALCLLIYRIRKTDPQKRTPFLIVNITLTVLLVLMVFHEMANQIWQSYLAFVFHVGLFCWAPLIWYFANSITRPSERQSKYLYMLPPAFALLVVLIRIFNIRVFDFLAGTSANPFRWVTITFIITGFVFNFVFYLQMWRHFSFLRISSAREPKENIVYYFFRISLVALLLVPVNLLLIALGMHADFIEDFYLVAVTLSCLIFVETYFLWRYPEILREEKVQVPPTENLATWMEKLNGLMQQSKPYKNPDLSVSELADLLGTKPHVLSKMINDSYHKNFRDFVNAYRIEEFIALANTREFRHYTFFALAQEVGFNSKSTFNLAFKKITSKSPSDYFKSNATAGAGIGH